MNRSISIASALLAFSFANTALAFFPQSSDDDAFDKCRAEARADRAPLYAQPTSFWIESDANTHHKTLRFNSATKVNGNYEPQRVTCEVTHGGRVVGLSAQPGRFVSNRGN